MVKVKTKGKIKGTQPQYQSVFKKITKWLAQITLFLLVISSILLMQVNLPDIPSSWRLYWFNIFFLFLFIIGLILLWIKQGYIKIYWGRFALGFVLVISILGIKNLLDQVSLTYNLFDKLAIVSLPLDTVFSASVLAMLVLVLFLNYFRGNFESLIQYFQSIVVGLLVLSAVLISYTVHFKNRILVNGGINYFFKGILLSINKTPVLQAILTLGLGGAAISTVIYLSFAIYWLVKSNNVETTKIKILTIAMAALWLVLSFLTALMSIDIFVMWLILLILVGGIYLSKATKLKESSLITKMFVVTLFSVLLISLGFGLLTLAHVSAAKVLKNYVSLQIANILAPVFWVKTIKFISTVAVALGFYNYFPKLILLGVPFGTGAQFIQSLQLLGSAAKITPFFIYLLEFGVFAIISIVFLLVTLIRFIKLLDKDTLILMVLVPVGLYPLFFIPNVFGWILFFIALGFILAVVFNAEIVTLGLYKLGSGNRRTTSILWFFAILGVVGGYVVLGNLFRVYKDYHYLVHAQNKAITSINEITNSYLKLVVDKKNNKEQALNSLDKNKINQVRVNIQQFLAYSQRLEHRTSNAQLIDLSRFYLNKQLAAVAVSYPNLYSYVLGAPNTDGLNNYIASVYSLQKDVKLPIVYKELAKAWLTLNKWQKNPVYISRATMNYDKYLWFKPLDYEVLDSYISILLQQYQSLTSNQNNTNSNKANQLLNAINVRMRVLLQMFNVASNNLYMQTGDLWPLLKLTAYKAQYYIYSGEKVQAQNAFEELKNFVRKNSKINEENRDKLLKLIQQIEDSIMKNDKQIMHSSKK